MAVDVLTRWTEGHSFLYSTACRCIYLPPQQLRTMTEIALFGSTGQIGRSILWALLTKAHHEIVQVDRPASESKAKDISVRPEQRQRLMIDALDPLEASI